MSRDLTTIVGCFRKSAGLFFNYSGNVFFSEEIKIVVKIPYEKVCSNFMEFIIVRGIPLAL